MSGNSERIVGAATAPAMTEDGPARQTTNYNGLIVFICMAQLVVTIDTAVMGIVLPSITRAFPGDSEGLTWVAAASTLTFASLLMLGGRLSDLFGQKICCLAGLALFAMGAVLSALATNIIMLIAARALLGVGLATVTPANFSLLNGTLPAGPIRHRAFGWFVAVAGVALIFGYVLGGSVVTLLGWRAAFLIAPPAAAVAAVLAARYIPASTAARVKQPMDLPGALLVVLGTGLLVLSFSFAGRTGWLSPKTLGALAAGLGAFGAFAFVETRTTAPLLPMTIFRTTNVTAANLVSLCAMGASGGFFFLPNIYMQQVLHFSAARAGVAVIPQAITSIVMGRFITLGMGKLSLRRLGILGCATFLFGLLCFLRLSSDRNYVTGLLPALIISSAGSVVCASVLAAAATQHVSESRQGVASGLAFASQQVGMGFGVSIILTIVGSSSAHGESMIASLHHGFVATAAFGAVALVLAVVLMQGPRSAPAG